MKGILALVVEGLSAHSGGISFTRQMEVDGMYPETPEDVHHQFADAFNRGDLTDLVALYEPGATLVPVPGQIASGVAAIREALTGLLALKGRIDLRLRKVVRAGDIAQVISSWVIAGTNSNGSPVTLKGETTDVVRRQVDGRWLLVIDNPYGAAGAG